MLDEGKGCVEVMEVVAGVRGAVNGLMGQVIEDHIRHHLAAEGLTQQERNEGAAELIDVVRAYQTGFKARMDSPAPASASTIR